MPVRLWLGDEGDMRDARALAGVNNLADVFIAGILVAANLDVRLRQLRRNCLQTGEQGLVVCQATVAPVDGPLRSTDTSMSRGITWAG